MKTFDVFLKDRLIKMDLIISTLISREVFSFYDKMIINCMLNEIAFLKEIQGQINMTIDTEVQQLYAKVYNMMKTVLSINSSVDISEEVFTSVKSNVELFSNSSSVVKNLLTSFNDYKTIISKLDSFDTKLSLGNSTMETILSTNKAETDKIGYVISKNELVLLSDVDFSSEKITNLNSIDMEFKVYPFGLFYLALADGKTSMNIHTAEIDELKQNKILYGSTFNTAIVLEVLDLLEVVKYLFGSSGIELFSSVDWTISKIIYPTNLSMKISCEASIGVYRRRLLYEVDNIVLSDLDNNILKDLDYILIE